MMKTLPKGRGFWIWHLDKCESGDINKIIQKCHDCNIEWLSIKAGDQGRVWKQLTKENVAAFQHAGIKVFGWSYDTPSSIRGQVDVVKHCVDLHCDGFIIDAEVEWDNDSKADEHAKQYTDTLNIVTPGEFVIGDAPWPVISYHQSFPFTAFARGVYFRCPQNYWPENGLSAEAATKRYLEQWEKYEAQDPTRKRPRLASGYSIKTNVKEMLVFESMIKAHGELGCCYWVYDNTKPEVFEGLKGIPFGGK